MGVVNKLVLGKFKQIGRIEEEIKDLRAKCKHDEIESLRGVFNQEKGAFIGRCKECLEHLQLNVEKTCFRCMAKTRLIASFNDFSMKQVRHDYKCTRCDFKVTIVRPM